MSKKDTNPKDAIGISKRPTSTIPTTVIAELGVAMLEGALKYGRHNYRVAGVRASVYKDAAKRHIDAWWEGQDIDPDSGLNHLIKAMASLTVLRDGVITGNWNDDRPPINVGDDFWKELDKKTAALIAKYPDPVAPYTEVGEREKEVVNEVDIGSTSSDFNKYLEQNEKGGMSMYGQVHPAKKRDTKD